MLKEVENKIIEQIKNNVPELKTVKSYEGDLTSDKISKLPVIAPFVFVIYLGRNLNYEVNEKATLLKFRLIIGNISYKQKNIRDNLMDMLEKIETTMLNLEITKYNMEPFRLKEEGLFFSDDKFSIYFQDYEAYKF